ncbi:PAS domain-containing protein [Pelagibius sp. Alg239-R121]|uniref:PAS domain-containing protein n=1 Tax=Pelagibius sp. Alg239-R121 TaxID=2993448 RepID=UPI0024A6BA9B|nr:PAS domain-containing protein [Pelagibius sp. Alg239-R121]
MTREPLLQVSQRDKVATRHWERERRDALYSYWKRKRGARAFPSRADIDPTEMPTLLPNIILVDVTSRTPPQFRFRLVGTAIVQLYGVDFTGRYLDEIETGGMQAIIRRGYEQTVSRAEPCFQEGEVRYQNRFQIHYLRAILPLGQNDRRVDMLLAGVFFCWPDVRHVPDL